MPDKHVTLTTKCWAHFMSICKKVDNEAREVNHQTRPVAYRAHIGELYYVSVTTGYGSVVLHSIRPCERERVSYSQWN